MDRKIKLLLMKLNMQGHDVSLIKEQRYSKEFNGIYTRYKLTFWVKAITTTKNGAKIVSKPDTYEFKQAAELLKYMVVRMNERKAEGVC